MTEVIDTLLVIYWVVMRDLMSDLHYDLLVLCMAVVYEFGGSGGRVGCDARGCRLQIWGR